MAKKVKERKASKKRKSSRKVKKRKVSVNQSNKQIVQLIFNDQKPRKKITRRRRGNQLYNTLYQPSFAPQRIWHTPRDSNWTGALVKQQAKYDYQTEPYKTPSTNRKLNETPDLTNRKLDFEAVKNKEVFELPSSNLSSSLGDKTNDIEKANTPKRRGKNSEKTEEEKETDEFYRQQEIARSRPFNIVTEIFNSGIGGRVKRRRGKDKR
jgi:hypothetical protein